jgi:hypothetical protein
LRIRILIGLLGLLAGCQEEQFSYGTGSLSQVVTENEFPLPPRAVQTASLEVRSALALEAGPGYFGERLEVFKQAELAWFRTRLVGHFDRVHALTGPQRTQAAKSGRIAPMVLEDLTRLRELVLAEPDVETEVRPGGVPDTVDRLLEHSRLRVRVAVAGLDSRIRDMEARLRRPVEVGSDGHLSIVETDIGELTAESVRIQILRIELLPWIFQFLSEADSMALLEDPAVQGWLFSQRGDTEAP